MKDLVMTKYKNMPLSVKAAFWFTICNLLQKGISFITVPIFTRMMTTSEYGLYNIYISWYSVITIFATLHLSFYVFNKGLVKYEVDRENFTISIQSLSAVVTLIFIGIYLIFRESIDSYIKLPSSMMVCMLIQILFEPPVLYWTARKRFDYQYKSVLFVTISMAVLNPVLGIVLIKIGAFSNSAVARAVSLASISVLFGFVIATGLIRKADAPFSTKYWKYALAFNLPLIPHYLSSTILSSADRIMIGDMIGESEAGLYSVAYSIGMICTLFSQSIQQAYLPWLYKRLKAEEYDGIPWISNSFLAGMICLLALVMCFAPEVVWIVGSDKYLDAIWALPPICGSIFFIFLQNLFSNIEYYYEKTKMIAVASIGAAILNIILNYIYISKFGYLAAAYTTLFCYFVYATVHFFVVKRVCKSNNVALKQMFDIKMILLFSLVIFATVGIMLMVYKNTLIRYSIFIAIAVLLLIYRNKIRNIIKVFRSKR